MIVVVDQLQPGDRVVLPPPPFARQVVRTVDKVEPAPWDARMRFVTYRQAASEKWSSANADMAEHLWQTTAWYSLADVLEQGSVSPDVRSNA